MYKVRVWACVLRDLVPTLESIIYNLRRKGLPSGLHHIGVAPSGQPIPLESEEERPIFMDPRRPAAEQCCGAGVLRCEMPFRAESVESVHDG